jgi:Flp pilus assembly protein TadD
LTREGDFEDAEKYMKEAVSIDPENDFIREGYERLQGEEETLDQTS